MLLVTGHRLELVQRALAGTVGRAAPPDGARSSDLPGGGGSPVGYAIAALGRAGSAGAGGVANGLPVDVEQHADAEQVGEQRGAAVGHQR